VKNNISGYGNYIFGVNIADFGRANRFSYGLQLDLNIWMQILIYLKLNSWDLFLFY